MAYRINKMDDLMEVHVWDEVSVTDVLTILGQLHAMAPLKEISDLWMLSEGCMIPWDEFSTVAKGIKNLVAKDAVARPSAVVAANQFHRAQLELFLHEARELPYEIGIFSERDEAVNWLQAKSR